MQIPTKYLFSLLAIVALQTTDAVALSVAVDRQINFPAGYDPVKRTAILLVVQDKGFEFVGGNVSYWPPDWGTRLSYTGDAASLNKFMKALRGIRGVGLSVVLYRGRDEELRRDSPWQLDFSQAHPDRLTVYLNLNAKGLDWDKVQLPEWPPRP